MNNYLSNFLVRFLAILIGAGICFFVYSACELDLVFGSKISYLQWIGISVIVTVISPGSFKTIKNDTKNIKIS